MRDLFEDYDSDPHIKSVRKTMDHSAFQRNLEYENMKVFGLNVNQIKFLLYDWLARNPSQEIPGGGDTGKSFHKNSLIK
jgi:hypothetical protein